MAGNLDDYVAGRINMRGQIVAALVEAYKADVANGTTAANPIAHDVWENAIQIAKGEESASNAVHDA